MITRFPRALLFVALGHLTLELCSNFMPVLYPTLIPAMGLSFTQVGTIALVAGTTTSLTQPFFGMASDRWGADKVSALAISWTALAMGLIGFAGNYNMLLILVALGGLGSAAFHPPGAVVAAANSGSKRGTGVSIFSVGGNLGSALSPLWVGTAVLLFGMGGTITILPLALVVSLALLWQLRQARKTAPPGASRERREEGSGFTAGMIFIVLAVMCRSWFQVSLTTYLPIWIAESGGTALGGGRMLAVMLFSIGIGSLVGGALGDRIGNWQVVMTSLFLLSPVYFLFLNGAPAVQNVAIFGIGVLIGSTFPVTIVMAIDAWPGRVGLASGMVMGLGWWPGGLGASFTGMLADQYSLLSSMQTLLFVPLLGATFVLVYALLLRGRQPILAPRV